jgi:hypothetical protein
MDAMDEAAGGGGRGWEKLSPEERTKLRTGDVSLTWERRDEEEEED